MTPQAGTAGPMPPFFVYRDLLGPEDHAVLLAWTLEHESSFRPSLLGDHVHDPSRRSSRSLPASAEGPWAARLRERIDALKPGLFGRAGLKPFEVSRTELEMVAYGEGAHYKIHVDTTLGGRRGEDDRLLSGVYYFHSRPKGFSGGELRLHRFGTSKAREGDYVDIAPEQNSLLIFPSWAGHEVRRVSCPSDRFADFRFAINIWLRRAR